MIDLPLVHILPSVIYSTLAFALTGLRQSVHHFFLFLLTNLMAKLVGSAMCYFVAASTSTFGMTMMLASIHVVELIHSD